MAFNFLVYGMLGSIPIFLVWLVGGIFCMTRAWRFPKACLLTGLAIAISIGIRLVFPLLWQMLNSFFSASGSSEDMAFAYFVQTLLSSTAGAVAWGLMLWVIFGPGGAADLKKTMPWEEDAALR